MPGLAVAERLLREGRAAEALERLEQLAKAARESLEARYLEGVALRMAGDLPAAIAAFEAALALAPAAQPIALELARLLNATGDHRRCLDLTERAATADTPAAALLGERARAFQALGREDERLATREHIARLGPPRPASLHNLAAAAGDAGYPERAEAAAREALALGGDAPETWLVLARALQASGRHDEADAAFGAALARQPGFVPALRDRAQLAWMRSGDLAAALAVLDTAAAALAPEVLLAERARVYEGAGEARRGYERLVAGRSFAGAAEAMVAARLALGFDPASALAHARQAAEYGAGGEDAERLLADALLAADLPQEALGRIEALLAAHPLDQGLVARKWIAWRLLGDPRAAALYDYEALVARQAIDVPPGWASLADYLADLAEMLEGLHGFAAHPLGQSLRSGTQTARDLVKLDHPVARALPAALDGPIRAYLERLGTGDDPLRARNTGGYRFAGMWSVRLRPGGRHVGHVHPSGWISSACHVALPAAVADDAADGWLAFGEPGTPTGRPLAAEHLVQPVAGSLVLFPSFMWHATLPFAGAEPRLTIAFDLLPA